MTPRARPCSIPKIRTPKKVSSNEMPSETSILQMEINSLIFIRGKIATKIIAANVDFGISLNRLLKNSNETLRIATANNVANCVFAPAE